MCRWLNSSILYSNVRYHASLRLFKSLPRSRFYFRINVRIQADLSVYLCVSANVAALLIVPFFSSLVSVCLRSRTNSNDTSLVCKSCALCAALGLFESDKNSREMLLNIILGFSITPNQREFIIWSKNTWPKVCLNMNMNMDGYIKKREMHKMTVNWVRNVTLGWNLGCVIFARKLEQSQNLIWIHTSNWMSVENKSETDRDCCRNVELLPLIWNFNNCW